MLKRLLILSLSIVVLFIVLDACVKDLLLKNINLKTCYITNHKIEADIVIHGPCEPEWMMDPAIIDSIVGSKTYNLGLNHSDFADNFLSLYLYLKHQKAPKYLFLYATPISFDKNLANTFNTYRFTPFLDDSVVAATVSEMDPVFMRYSFIPFLKYAYYSDYTYLKALQGGMYFLTKREIPEHVNGYAPALSSWNTAISAYRSNTEYFKAMQWDSMREKYFRKTIELALSRGCKVYVYESPIYKPDEQLIQNRSEMLAKVKHVTDSCKVPFLIFDTLPMAEDRLNFFSTYNTTFRGSIEFSKVFGSYIKEHIYKSEQQIATRQ